MLWLALKLRRDPAHENPTIVIVTDRKDLDEQIAEDVPRLRLPEPGPGRERARSARAALGAAREDHPHDGAEVPGPRGARATVRSGVTAKSSRCSRPPATSSSWPTRRTGPSTAGSPRTCARRCPNACFFGFTGHAHRQEGSATLQTFGAYIDTYTIEQAVADGATVPIFYEGRLPELRIIGNTLDAVFDRVFADRTDEEREAIKKKYATEAPIAGAPKRVEAICLDIIEHYTKFIQPNGFKAQIVAVSRETAVLYKETLDRLNAPQSAVIISGTNTDDERARPSPHERGAAEGRHRAVLARRRTRSRSWSSATCCSRASTRPSSR